MAKKSKPKKPAQQTSAASKKQAAKPSRSKQKSTLPWVIAVIAVTGVCMFPMFSNGFTNWDDEIYVTNNPLLRGPDWQGIFTQPVSGNYHPLTLISLVINYKLSGLNPTSYILFNYLLHLVNTALVFRFVWILSEKKLAVAFFTALIFGIHPMHVESVAWISERKDVLYTLFFLLSLLQYWRYLQKGRMANYWLSLLLFVLSLLSKPAAVILPIVLFLLDYWKGIAINKKTLLQKIPFLILSLVFGILTIKMQSPVAIVGLESYPWWSRLLFACYVIMIYFFRFFIPYPLSAFHPYPQLDHLGWPVFISPIFIIALAVFVWYQRKNKPVIFGLLFFIVNLLLVLQIISIGLTIVSERYTYVPYIGLAFAISFVLWDGVQSGAVRWAVASAVTVIFGIMNFQRTKVWKDSNQLWTDVIKHYPDSPVPRTNRANYLIREANKTSNAAERDALLLQALEDCNVAVDVRPNHIQAYEDRQSIYYNLNKDKEALADAEMVIKLDPGKRLGYYSRGLIYSACPKTHSKKNSCS